MIEKYKDNIILKCLVGSHCYGIAHEKSDKDYRGIFVLPKNDYNLMDSRLLLNKPYLPQISSDGNDETFYELKRFLELTYQGNPNCIEILFLEDEFYEIRSDITKEIFDNKQIFLNKKFANSLLGFIDSQIRKATGANKKSFNPVAKELKTPLDFCYALIENDRKIISYPLKKFLKDKNINQQACGISSIPNTRDNYNLFWDKKQQRIFFDKKPFAKIEKSFIKMFNKAVRYKSFSIPLGLGYKGIELEDKSSNMLRLSNIPKSEKSICQFTFHAQSYTDYLNDYHEYWNWVGKRNDHRYIENQLANKGYDTKNMAHCYRLLKMLEFFLDNNILKIDAEDKETIWKIKRGEFEYKELIQIINDKYKSLKKKIELSNLSENCDIKVLDNIEKNIRYRYYREG